jgi:hypothetical protein
MFAVKYELGFNISEDGIFHSHYRENLKSYTELFCFLSSVMIFLLKCLQQFVRRLSDAWTQNLLEQRTEAYFQTEMRLLC